MPTTMIPFTMPLSRTMKRIASLLALAALCFTLPACEEVVDADLPFVERLVVQGTLVPGQPADSIFIRRTVPLSAKYDSLRAILSDVNGYIEGGGKSYPLVHLGGSRYEATGLVPEVGVRYKLVAGWNGMEVQASTTIPAPPVVDTVLTVETMPDYPGQSEDHYSSIEALVHPRSGESYAMEVYDRRESRFDYYPVVTLNYHETLRRPDDTIADGRVRLLFDDYPISLNSPRARVIVYSFDLPFYDFYYSYLDEDEGGILFGNPRPVRWNVEGDGIGIFIGRSSVSVKIP